MSEPSATFSFTDPDGFEIAAYRWDPPGAPTAIVQIAHGAAEHALRYGRFADALTAKGWVVYADDHRGHGRTAGTIEKAGLAGDDGWNGIISDLGQLSDLARAEHPGLPLVLFGHSLGSLAAQGYAERFGDGLAGLVLSGSWGELEGIDVAIEFVDAEIASQGRDAPSPIFAGMFGAFNERFTPEAEGAPATEAGPEGPDEPSTDEERGERKASQSGRRSTGFEWLSRDEAEVDAYVADEWCGSFLFSSGLLRDFAAGMRDTWKPEAEARIPLDLPILTIAGTDDPAGGYSQSLRPLVARYVQRGALDVSAVFYADARHEVLNETNRDEVTADVVAWIERVLA